MPRYARLTLPTTQTAIYHVISRTALQNYPFGDVEKERFVELLQHFSKIYFTEILGYTILGNHFHIVCKMIPEHQFSDEEIKDRFTLYYGNEKHLDLQKIPEYRKRWSMLSKFIQDLKQTFSRYFNKMHNRRGTLWADRFKSVIVEEGRTLVNLLAYVDLNAVRAGIVEIPEEYRWCSLGYHVQTGNKSDFLSTDFGLKEFAVKDQQERLRRYRKYVYESGALNKHGQKGSVKIPEKIVEKERNKNFELSRTDRFRYRTRHFTDSGIIGSKTFVYENYLLFKHHFNNKKDKKPQKITGLDGIFSLRRLLEV